MIRYPIPAGPLDLAPPNDDGIRLHKLAEDMPHLPVGRFCRHPRDGRIYALACGFPAGEEAGKVLVSADEGATWKATGPLGDDDFQATDSGAFLITPEGTLVVGYSNLAEANRVEWDPYNLEGMTLPACATRSLDNGQTWQDTQRLHRNWTGANRDLIRTREGRLIISTQMLLEQPGRHAVVTYSSVDEGVSWSRSNVLDLGGLGHHDGTFEASLVELHDGRILMLIRTNWGQLWRAFSRDGGVSWHVYGPAGIEASSTPPFIERLASGRLVLVWNRQFPQVDDLPVRRWPGDGTYCATPTSNFRHELSISFSEDEAESWSEPVVIARHDTKEVCYPYLFEVTPGELWITAGRYNLHMRLQESDVLR